MSYRLLTPFHDDTMLEKGLLLRSRRGAYAWLKNSEVTPKWQASEFQLPLRRRKGTKYVRLIVYRLSYCTHDLCSAAAELPLSLRLNFNKLRPSSTCHSRGRGRFLCQISRETKSLSIEAVLESTAWYHQIRQNIAVPNRGILTRRVNKSFGFNKYDCLVGN